MAVTYQQDNEIVVLALRTHNASGILGASLLA